MGSTWETQRSLTPAMKIIGVLLLFMFTRAATAVTCATGTAVNCNACLYRFSEAGHMDIDTDNCDNSPDCKMVDDTCQDRPPLPSSTPTPYTSPPDIDISHKYSAMDESNLYFCNTHQRNHHQNQRHWTSIRTSTETCLVCDYM